MAYAGDLIVRTLRTKALLLGVVLGASGCELLFSTDGYGKPYREQVMADGPVVYLRLGETSGSVAHDIAGAHDGTYKSAAMLGVEGAIAGDDDTAASFDGTAESSVTMPAGFEFGGTSPFSVEVWMKQHTPHGFGFAVDHNNYNPRHGWSVRFSEGSVGLERYEAGSYAGTGAVANRGLADDHWHHVVTTYDGDHVALYIDGDAAFQGSGGTTMTAGTGPWTVGAQDCGGGCAGDFFIGTLDEVALYDKALAADRVAAHHTAGSD
jgi:hypothetical protein